MGDLDRQRVEWKKTSQLFPNYEYTAIVSCYCMPSYTSPKRIQVRNNTVVAVRDLGLNATVDVDTGAYRTIKQVFDNIQAGIDGHYFTMDVVYSDEAQGYPITYGYDVDPGMADEEQYVTILDFVVVLENEEEDQQQDVATIPTVVAVTDSSSDLSSMTTITGTITEAITTSGSSGTPGVASDTTTMVIARDNATEDDEEEADLGLEEAAPASTAVIA